MRSVPVAMLALSLSACAHFGGEVAEGAAEEATPVAIEQALQALNEPDNQELLRQLFAMPEIRQAAEELAQAVAQGALDGLSQDELQLRLQAHAERLAQRVTAGIASGIRSDVTPAVEQLAARAGAAAMRAALDDPQQARARDFAVTVTEAVVAAVAEGIRTEIAPALADSIGTNWEPAVEAASRSASRGIVFGIDDALVRLQEREGEPRGLAELLFGVKRAAVGGLEVSQLALAGLGLLVLLLLGWMALLLRRYRRAGRERARREQAVLLLARVIKQTETAPWGQDLATMLRRAMREDPGAAYLREVLNEHPELRLGQHR